MKRNRPGNRILAYTVVLYLVGLAFGMVLLRNQQLPPGSRRNFLEVFAANYWHIFLIWLLGFSLTGLLFTSVLIFFRGFLFGALMALLISFNLQRLFFLLLLETALFLPAFFPVSCFSLALSMRSFLSLFSYQNFNLKFYLNIMIIATIFIVIYSIIIVIRV